MRVVAAAGLLLVVACGSRTSLNLDAADSDAPMPVPELEPQELVYVDSDETAYRLLQVAVAPGPRNGVFVAGGNPVAVTLAGRRLPAGAFLAALDERAALRWVAPIASDDGGSRISSVAGTADGSVIVGGYLSDPVDFGGTRRLPKDSSGDGFVAKYDRNGKLVWVNVFGSSEVDRVDTIELGARDHVYVGGYVGGPADFGDGLRDASGHDAFLLELDARGELVRAELLPCDGEYSSLLGLARVGDDDVLATGYATGAIWVDGAPIGGADADYRGFWTRLSAGFDRRQGAPLDVKLARAAEATFDGGAFIGGELEGSTRVAGVELSASAEGGPLIVKLDAQGNAVWGTLVAPAGSLYDLVQHPRGDLYALGSRRSASDGYEPFLAAYDATGTQTRLLVWPERYAALTSAALTSGGHLWVAGYYESSISLGREPHEVPAASGFVLHFRPE